MFALVALAVGFVRAMRAFWPPWRRAFQAAAAGGARSPAADCVGAPRRLDASASARRRHGLHAAPRSSGRPGAGAFHHLTLYGFALCFASTTRGGALPRRLRLACALRLRAACPVVLGTLGGAGLLSARPGCSRCANGGIARSADPAQDGLDGVVHPDAVHDERHGSAPAGAARPAGDAAAARRSPRASCSGCSSRCRTASSFTAFTERRPS